MVRKIFNKHFFGMISIFVVVLVSVTTFISFIEDTVEHDKSLQNEVKII
ncbi:MAG: hypothetical protein KAI16_03115 [Candidatus Pacebacteria bacterium]|nr:hypothetical protein [Candidatus Paceibacterota bacterium]